MRIFLALLIFFFHSYQTICDYSILNDFFSLGAVAMTGFFMLSGYCLCVSYNNRNLANIKEIKTFYIKRVITIFPLYFFIAATYCLIALLNGDFNLKEETLLFPAELLCIQSTFPSLFTYSHNGGTWFLSCMMICYIVYPFLQEVFKQVSSKTKIIIALIVSIILFYAPIVQLGLKLPSIYTNPFYRLLEFSLGAVIAHLNYQMICGRALRFLKSKLSLSLFVLLFLIGITIAKKIGIPADFQLYNWIAIPCYIGMLIPLGVLPFDNIKSNRIIRFFSDIAFAFFLCQIFPIWKYSQIISSFIGMASNVSLFVISFSLCFIGAVLIHELIEKPTSYYLRSKLLLK